MGTEKKRPGKIQGNEGRRRGGTFQDLKNHLKLGKDISKGKKRVQENGAQQKKKMKVSNKAGTTGEGREKKDKRSF